MMHQLRYLLGDAAFFRGLREYLKRFAFRNVDTHDFMRVMEETSGVSLESVLRTVVLQGRSPRARGGLLLGRREPCSPWSRSSRCRPSTR